jgi:hypothetical protein
MPQGSILGPLLFINNIWRHIETVDVHFYVDDTVLYSNGSRLTLVFEKAQTAFNIIQHNLYDLRLVVPLSPENS